MPTKSTTKPKTRVIPPESVRDRLSFAQAAEYLGVSRATLYRIADRFPIRHPHRRGWYVKSALKAFADGKLSPKVVETTGPAPRPGVRVFGGHS